MLRVVDPLADVDPGEPLSRRECLRAGGVGLGGLTLPALLASRAVAAPQGEPTSPSFGRARSVILFVLNGGPPQHETWDPKPDAPREIRGEFGTIPSRTPGYRVGELMPRTAQLTDRIAVLRAVTTDGDNAHSTSGYQMLTGVPHAPLNRENALPGPPNDWPVIGSLVRAAHSGPEPIPAAVTIPEHIWNDGNKPWPGQDAGILGKRHDPWLIHCDPSSPDFRIPGLVLPAGVSRSRAVTRRELLESINRRVGAFADDASVRSYGVHARKALEMLTSPSARGAFDLSLEPEKVRDRYGRGRYAQSCLLARRLVEAGVSLVQINWTRIKGLPNQGGWDTHQKHSSSCKSILMPMMDQAFSALIEDLDARGLLDETLVVWTGEFGRTPKFNKNAGRDHWGHCFSIAMVGGGVQGGAVHGASDKHAAFPASGIVRPRDVIATVFHCLGHGPGTEVDDLLGRPVPLTRGKPIDAVL